MDPNIRIGDAERDEAIKRLRAHHAAGRIEMYEFDDRLEKALAARTAGDLRAIFTDLPGDAFDAPRPASALMAQVPATVHPPVMRSVEARPEKSGGVSTGIIWIVLVITFMTGFRLWPLLVGVGIWWLIASAANNARRQPQITGPPQRFYFADGDINAEVIALTRAGRKIEAIKRYREVYPNLGLKEAKETVERIEREAPGIGY